MSPDRLRFSDLFNVAGALTLARLPLAFITAFVMHDPFWFPAVFVIAMATDVLDGPVARWTGTDSRTGAVADGWADKIFLINYAWTMRMTGHAEPWHLWLWFGRELVQGAMVPLVALDYANRVKPFPKPVLAGKVCTVAVTLAMACGLAGWDLARDVLTGVAGLSGAIAVVIYLRRDKPWQRFTRA